jgi:hypothetical protein
MTCNCLDTVNSKMGETSPGWEIAKTLFWDGKPSRPLLTVQKTSDWNRGCLRSITVLPIYCPFCSKRYEETADV